MTADAASGPPEPQPTRQPTPQPEPHAVRRDRAAVLSEGLASTGRWSLRFIAIAVVLYILGWTVGQTWVIWFPVLLALIVSTVLAPPVTWLRGRGLPDLLAAIVVMLVGLGALAVLFSFMIPQIIDEAPGIADEATGGLGAIQQWLTGGPLNLSEEQINGYLAAIADQIQSSADVISSGVFAGLSGATNAIVNLAIILVLTFLFIKDGHRFLPWVDRVSGRRVGGHLTEVLGRMWNTIGGFIRTQALVSFIDAVIIGIGLVVVGVPLAIPLALLTFIGGFIPIVGALVTGALAVLVTLVTNSFGDAVIVLLIILAVQQLEGNVLSPWLQGKIMQLHAALILLSVAAGSTLFGITGAFLAVPVVAAVAELMRYLDQQVTLATAPGAEPGRSPDAGDDDVLEEHERRNVGVTDQGIDEQSAEKQSVDTRGAADHGAADAEPGRTEQA